MRKGLLLHSLFTVLILCMTMCAVCSAALAADESCFYIVKADKVNLRKESGKAGGDATIAGTVYTGTVLRVKNEQPVNGYLVVLLDDGTQVYAHKTLLERTNATAPTPLTLEKLQGSETSEKAAEKTSENAADAKSRYYLYYEKGSFTLTVFGMDEEGNYTKVIGQWRTAHGGNKTPTGKFTILGKERWHQFPGGGYTQYATRYHKKLYLHSGIYKAKDPTTMYTSYYDGSHGIGKASSGGCLRMVCAAAKWIYQNCPVGTVLEIVNGSPLGTVSPAPPALAQNENGGIIDPTDTDAYSKQSQYMG